MGSVRKNHHYVSQSYLKAWGKGHNKIWTYRVLVSHDSVPIWSQSSIRNIAKQQHLYTRSIAGSDSDDIEMWMDQEIETPAQMALSKARINEPLDNREWSCLLRFVALHDIRSPANYITSMNRWKSEMPEVIEEVLKSSDAQFEVDRSQSPITRNRGHQDSTMIPMKVSKEIVTDSEFGHLKAEVLLGRGLWLFSIRHLLTNTYKVLNQHNWSIIQAPKGLEWLTSDNPVVKLNYYRSGSYDFKGGWGNKGTEIIFPLSPNVLLYTQVGETKRLHNISVELAMMLNRFIAENAHRYIFAASPINGIGEVVPRVVNNDAYRNENMEWENWHARHKKLEMEYQDRFENN
jgi:hypothetical protein